MRAFRGIDERRRFDINALSLTDLATAQQNLSASVTAYLGILGSLWSSVVSVADPLETDDLFQLAEPKELPPLPDLEHLAPLPCRHPLRPGGGRRLPDDLSGIAARAGRGRPAGGAPRGGDPAAAGAAGAAGGQRRAARP